MITKFGNKPMQVDTQTNRITFLDTRFYFLPDGTPVPSVTTVLDGAYPKGAQFYEWLKKNGQDSDDIRDEAGRKGSNVHDFTDRYDNGQEVSLLNASGYMNCTLTEWAMFERYVEFSNRIQPEHILIEQNFVSPFLGTGGTVDRVSKINGKKILLDIKTGNAIYPHYFIQLAIYFMLAVEQGVEVDECVILWLNAKTRTDGKGDAIQGKGWQLIKPERPLPEYYNTFKHCQALWQEEFGSMVPKEKSYSLTHKK
jgi:hypothetical protein